MLSDAVSDAGALRANVGIVIPLFNKEGTILRAVRSIQEQSYSDWVLMIVDDGSTDSSLATVQHMLDGRRIHVISSPNRGPGAARNLGARMLDCTYLAFLDADDEWLPDFLEWNVRCLNGHEDVNVATCFMLENEAPITAAGALHPLQRLDPVPKLSNCEIKARVDSLHSSSTVVRRVTFESFGGFYDREHTTFGEDSYMWLQILLGGGVVQIDRSLVRFHTSDSSLSRGRNGPLPVPPVLLDPPSFPNSLLSARRTQEYISWYAFWVARRSVHQGVYRQALVVAALKSGRPSATWFCRLAFVSAACIRSITRGANLYPGVRARMMELRWWHQRG